MDITKSNKFHLLKKEAEEFGRQSRSLDNESRASEHT